MSLAGANWGSERDASNGVFFNGEVICCVIGKSSRVGWEVDPWLGPGILDDVGVVLLEVLVDCRVIGTGVGVVEIA